MADWGFWAAAALIAAVVAALLVRALGRGRGEAAAAEADMAVYKDQMAEVERDLARGTISAEEAKRLRAEVGRRLLDLDRQRAPGAAASAAPATPVAALVALVVLGGGLGAYRYLGSPGYPDLPIERRIAMADDRMAGRPAQAEAVAAAPKLAPPEVPAETMQLIEKLRETVARRPDDPVGLELLARNETALGNFADAEAAQRHLIAVKGGTVAAADHSALAEILIAAAGGYVSPEAEAELTAALSLDPKDGLARYYAGLMFVQGGRYDRGFALWSGLLEESGPDAPWTEPLRAQIEEVAWRAGVNYRLPEVTGPTAGDMAAAAEMSEEERQAMIEGMVTQLSDRLASEGGGVEDWARLIRSQAMLERLEEAQKAYDAAVAEFQGQPAELSFLRQAAVEAGLNP
ncbi:c-type cytochrome biogenesis protein CcmI [Tabrizicola soli]|uniref:C-type cytochrome biogenesis protein CcmI n=1 Tax=Tabrizicola soli TaxID=2185115 RepID=A0ABV7DVE5_9RHOB|nr:c-type cytochrome biogenesis protein CcmI [Tabrizicola soli]